VEKKKKNALDFYRFRTATVATRLPSTPPNLNVGYVRTWST